MSEAKARRNDPETSHEAAETVNVSRDRRAVLWAFWHRGQQFTDGLELLTDGAIWDCVTWSYPAKHGTQQSLRSRRAELVRDGYIEVATYDGTPLYGRTAYHRRCRLYRLTLKGRELARSIF